MKLFPKIALLGLTAGTAALGVCVELYVREVISLYPNLTHTKFWKAYGRVFKQVQRDAKNGIVPDISDRTFRIYMDREIKKII